MRVLRGRAAQNNTDRPEPVAPQRCDACGNAGNEVEHREDSGIIYTICVAVVRCQWRKVCAL